MKPWQQALVDEWNERQRARGTDRENGFTLVEQNFEAEEILAMAEVLLSGKLTMGSQVLAFEKRFAEFVGSPYAVMVNSGSAANLLALAVATNPVRGRRLQSGDEILVPAVCWSTSVWPLLQVGLKPVFVDVDPETLNLDLRSMREKTTSKTRGLLAVHVLGNCAPMDEVMAFAREHQWIVIEDTCESLGTQWYGNSLGTLGDLGTYSFYFSHHMTTGEGGMVVARSLEDYDLLKCLRAHGWTRELSNRAELEARHIEVDPRFLFVNVGYNMRPMEVQAALGLQQLSKLPQMNGNRIDNWSRLITALKTHPRWKGQLLFPRAPLGAKSVWFGFPALLADSVKMNLRDYLQQLSQKGVENRPVVSGNFARQPGLKLFSVAPDLQSLPGAEKIHNRGFFVGLHAQRLTDAAISDLADRML